MTTTLMRALSCLSCAVFLTLFSVQRAGAQVADAESQSRREILSSSPVPADSARNSCIMLGSARWSGDVYQSGSCRARGCAVAGITSRDGWVTCSYEHEWISPASGSQPADTLREVEVVLYRTPAAASDGNPAAAQQFTPVWQEIYEPELLRSVTPSVTTIPGGNLLLEIQECVNGTGGCEQSFLLDPGRSWRPVKLTFLDAVDRRYPGTTHRAFHVDTRRLMAEVWLYSEKDPNCCPSRSAVVSLRLRGDALEAKAIRLKPS